MREKGPGGGENKGYGQAEPLGGAGGAGGAAARVGGILLPDGLEVLQAIEGSHLERSTKGKALGSIIHNAPLEATTPGDHR